MGTSSSSLSAWGLAGACTGRVQDGRPSSWGAAEGWLRADSLQAELGPEDREDTGTPESGGGPSRAPNRWEASSSPMGRMFVPELSCTGPLACSRTSTGRLSPGLSGGEQTSPPRLATGECRLLELSGGGSSWWSGGLGGHFRVVVPYLHPSLEGAAEGLGPGWACCESERGVEGAPLASPLRGGGGDVHRGLSGLPQGGARGGDEASVAARPGCGYSGSGEEPSRAVCRCAPGAAVHRHSHSVPGATSRMEFSGQGAAEER